MAVILLDGRTDKFYRKTYEQKAQVKKEKATLRLQKLNVGGKSKLA